MVTIFLKVRNCSVPSQLRAKIPSPPAMGFLLVCLGIGLHSQTNTSRNSGLLNSHKISIFAFFHILTFYKVPAIIFIMIHIPLKCTFYHIYRKEDTSYDFISSYQNTKTTIRERTSKKLSISQKCSGRRPDLPENSPWS